MRTCTKHIPDTRTDTHNERLQCALIAGLALRPTSSSPSSHYITDWVLGVPRFLKPLWIGLDSAADASKIKCCGCETRYLFVACAFSRPAALCVLHSVSSARHFERPRCLPLHCCGTAALRELHHCCAECCNLASCNLARLQLPWLRTGPVTVTRFHSLDAVLQCAGKISR